MSSSRAAWFHFGNWYHQRGRIYLAGIVIFAVFWTAFIYLSWGPELSAQLVVCMASFPTALLVGFGLVVLIMRSGFGPPALVTKHRAEDVLHAVEEMLDRHGVEYQTYTYDEYLRSHGEKKTQEAFLHFTSERGNYVIIVPGGIIVFNDEHGRGCQMQPLPATAMSDEMKAEIVKKLAV